MQEKTCRNCRVVLHVFFLIIFSQMKDADKCKGTENVKQQSNPNDTVDKPAPAPLADESYGYSEDSDVASIPNNPHVDKTEIVDHPIEGGQA
jgi:hypothetical protein